MSYADRETANSRDIEYAKLLVQQVRAKEVVTNWVTRATALHGETVDPADKAELIALRDAFSLELQTILGV